jgi:hypothetical protein
MQKSRSRLATLEVWSLESGVINFNRDIKDRRRSQGVMEGYTTIEEYRHRGRFQPKKRKRTVPQVSQPTYILPPHTPQQKPPPPPQNSTHTPKRHRDHPPQTIMVKYERVMTQRMFLIERSGRENGALEEEFSVLGSTGNVYIVNVNMIPQ